MYLGRVIDKQLFDKVLAKAKATLRHGMNIYFHQSLDEKCHRFLNALGPGTNILIHRHPSKDDAFVLLRV